MPPSVEGWSCDGWTCGGGSLTWDLVDSEQVSHGYSAGDDERQYLRREAPLGEQAMVFGSTELGEAEEGWAWILYDGEAFPLDEQPDADDMDDPDYVYTAPPELLRGVMTATSQSLTILLSAGGGFRLVSSGEGGTVTAVTADSRPVGANTTAANSTASPVRTQPPPLERGSILLQPPARLRQYAGLYCSDLGRVALDDPLYWADGCSDADYGKPLTDTRCNCTAGVADDRGQAGRAAWQACLLRCAPSCCGECRNAWSPSCDMDSLLEEIPAGQMATLVVVLLLGL